MHGGHLCGASLTQTGNLWKSARGVPLCRSSPFASSLGRAKRLSATWDLPLGNGTEGRRRRWSGLLRRWRPRVFSLATRCRRILPLQAWPSASPSSPPLWASPLRFRPWSTDRCWGEPIAFLASCFPATRTFTETPRSSSISRTSTSTRGQMMSSGRPRSRRTPYSRSQSLNATKTAPKSASAPSPPPHHALHLRATPPRAGPWTLTRITLPSG